MFIDARAPGKSTAPVPVTDVLVIGSSALPNTGRTAYRGAMGEVTVTVKLTNFMERERSETGEQIEPRSREVLAVIDTGAVRSVIPATLAAELGLRVRPGRKTTMADGRTVIAGVAQGLILELFGRETQEEAIVLGDEVLIGQTTLEATDVVVDCRARRAYPNPAHPDGPVWKVR